MSEVIRWNLVQKIRIGYGLAIISLPSIVPIAFASHGFWQAARASPCLHPLAKNKTPPRPFPAVLKPSACAWLRQLLGDPLGSLGLYSSRHGSYTCHWAVPWLDKACLCFWRTRHKCFYISQNHLTLRQSNRMRA